MPDNTRAEDLRRAADAVSTPEGDNEFAPDQPLAPSDVEADVDGLQRWPSNAAMEADKKRPASESDPGAHTGLRHVLDEIVTGKIQP